MHYYPHHLGDYAKDTGHLSLAEHGAYRLLLDHYYSTETALPANTAALCRICRANTRQEKQAVESVLRQFFTVSENGFSQRRAEFEIAELRRKSNLASQAGKASGKARKAKGLQEKEGNGRSTDVQQTLQFRSDSVASAVEPSNNQEPVTIVLLKKEPKGGGGFPEVSLPAELHPELHEAWKDWCEYRIERALTKGKRNLAWTEKAAQLSAGQIIRKAKRLGHRIVCDRIHTAIASCWQGTGVDRLDESKPASAKFAF